MPKEKDLARVDGDTLGEGSRTAASAIGEPTRQVVAYRVEQTEGDNGDWHILTFSDGTARHILTQHPTVEIEAVKQ